jgi:hypothetical protein
MSFCQSNCGRKAAKGQSRCVVCNERQLERRAEFGRQREKPERFKSFVDARGASKVDEDEDHREV